MDVEAGSTEVGKTFRAKTAKIAKEIKTKAIVFDLVFFAIFAVLAIFALNRIV